MIQENQSGRNTTKYTKQLKVYLPCSVLIHFFFRIATRGIASVVNKNDITVSDFKVKNEPILGYLQGR